MSQPPESWRARPQRAQGFRVPLKGSIGVSGLGFRVQGLGFMLQGQGFRVYGLGFRRFRVKGKCGNPKQVKSLDTRDP